MIKNTLGKCLGLFLCLSLAVAIFSPRAAYAQDTTLDIDAFHRAVPKNEAREIIFGTKTNNAPHIQGLTGTSVGTNNSGMIKVYAKDGKYYVLSEDDNKIAFPTRSNLLFKNYEQLKTIDFADVDTSQVEELSYLFDNCTRLEGVSLASFKTDKLRNADYLFQDCSALKSVDLTNFHCSSVTNMTGMFNGCSSLRTLDLTGFITNSLEHAINMFRDCQNLRTIFATDGFRTDKVTVTNATSMFTGCTSLVGGQGTVFDKNHTNKEYARIDGGTAQPGYFRMKTNNQYTITFNTNGGSAIGPTTVDEGVLLKKPQDPTKAGYTFAGWYTDAELTKAYDFANAVVDNMTLYAKWEQPMAPNPGKPNPGEPGKPDAPNPKKPSHPSASSRLQLKPSEDNREKKASPANTVKLSVKLKIGSTDVERSVQGAKTNSKVDVAPFIHNNRTMLPIRHVAESLGLDVQWIEKTRTVVLTDKTNRVEIPVDTNKIIVNGKVYESDTKAIMKNNRTYLPIANVARALGLVDGKEIIWNAEAQEVEITRTINLK